MPRKSQTSPPLSFWATELAYGGIQAYQNDKDAGRTNLDYRYWLAARTPEFKAEFGPWEQLRAQERLDKAEGVEILSSEGDKGSDLRVLRSEMRDILKGLMRNKETGKPAVPIPHPELGNIFVGTSGLKKSTSNSANPYKILTTKEICKILPKAIYSHSEPLNKEKSDRQLVGYSTLLAKVKIDEVSLVAFFTLERKTDGNWYYNTVVLDDEKEKTREFQAGGLTRTALVQGTPLAGLVERKRTPFERVNPDFVSKELNPETGEPTTSAICRFLKLSLNLGASDKKQEFQKLSPESQKLIQTARALRQAHHAETRKEGKARLLEAASEASKSIVGPGLTAIPLRAALKAFVTGKGGEHSLREFALAHDRAIARSRELSRGKSQSSSRSLGIDL